MTTQTYEIKKGYTNLTKFFLNNEMLITEHTFFACIVHHLHTKIIFMIF